MPPNASDMTTGSQLAWADYDLHIDETSSMKSLSSVGNSAHGCLSLFHIRISASLPFTGVHEKSGKLYKCIIPLRMFILAVHDAEKNEMKRGTCGCW
jgi:hypothetical protein